MAYIISKKINHGVYACIYKLENNSTSLAKVEKIRKSSVSKNEAEIHSRLSHPNIVKIIEAFKSDTLIKLTPSSTAYEFYQVIIMEKHGNETLETKRNITMELLKLYALQIAEGLAYLKRMNIIHRDLKPPNILVDEKNTVKICDFGLSCVGPQRSPGEQIGTPFYMPLTSFKGIYDFSTDIFSFGVILYQLYTKKMPYPAKNVRGLVNLVEFGHVCFLEEGGGDTKLEDLIRKMLQNEERITIEGVIEHEFFK